MVVRAVAPHITVDASVPPTKLVPVTVSVKAALPAKADVALIEVMVGAPTWMINGADTVPPEEFFTVRLSGPGVVRLAAGIRTVIAVEVPAVATSAVPLPFR